MRLTNAQSLEDFEDDLEKFPETIHKSIFKSFILDRLGESNIAISILSQKPDVSEFDELNLFAYKTIEAYTLWHTSKNLEMYNQIRDNLNFEPTSDNRFFQYFRAINLHLMGNYYWDDGKLTEAQKYFSESMELRKSVNDYSGMADSMANLGQIYQDIGDLDNSLKYFSNARKQYQKAKSNMGTMYVKLMLCEQERRFGNFESSLFQASECVEYYKKFPTSIFYALALHEYGASLRRLGGFQEARAKLKLAISIKEQVGNYFELFYSYLEYAYLLIEMDKTDELNGLMEIINKSPKLEQIRYISIMKKLIEAVIYTSRPKLTDKVIAQEKLEEILKDPYIEFHLMLKFLALVNLLELYIFELKITPNQTLVDNIRNYLDLLNELGDKASRPGLTIQCEIIKANFEIVLGNLELGVELLNQAQRHAMELKMKNLGRKIDDNIDQIKKLIQSWEEFLATEYSEKMKLINLQNYLKEVSQTISTHKY